MSNRLHIKVNKKNLPQMKERYPYLYLERGRLEIDDSSVKWINSDGDVIRIPCAVIASILLGPGTSITHEAVKVLAAANCQIQWTGEDGMIFYANGQSPTSNSRNLRRQIDLATDSDKSLAVARKMFAKRFPKEELQQMSLTEMMGLEGIRIRRYYEELAQKYQVGWSGRRYVPGHFELSSLTNQIMTAANAALYGIISSIVHSMGYSPHIGFIHKGSPLPFVYDMADLYKMHHSIDLAFYMSLKLAGNYHKASVLGEFRQRVIDKKLLAGIAKDLSQLLGKE